MPGQLIDGIDPTAVTGGNAHDHVGGDGASVPYATGLSGQPTLGTAAAQDVGAFAAAANGVTNGDSHDHSGGDGAQIAYSGLSGLPTLGTAAAKDTGTGADNVILGNDSRLTDARDPNAHASDHTDGTDDIQSATAAQKGLMTAAYASKLDGIEEAADVTDADNVATAGAVMDGDFTAADEVMVGTGAGTHAQVTLAASQLLGKKATGAVTNLAAADVRTILATPAALTADTTVNLTYGMTAAQIQALIDAQPKNLGGYTLTFQFGDGTYNTSMTARLTFSYFYGGVLQVQGNTGDTVPYVPGSNDPAVVLDVSGGTTDALYFFGCACRIIVQNLGANTADAAYAMAIDASTCSGQIIVQNVVLSAAGKVQVTIGIGAYSCSAVSVYSSFFSNQRLGISSQTSRLFSSGNNDYGTSPTYGLQSGAAGTIGKSGDQPNGSTNDELTESGGEIR